ncbi:conjugal transfer relaxosome DNA-binding protein TraM [Serratia fonticola]|uniref:Relaxosome protein TraM n=1 Tax=Serratia fonticola TaxID=47917 RepID=A0AAJ1YFS3_SERFO|nr:conjugal transfer relaxosome DNA-binding protein TraM [Serratia fonticola]MDQ9128492.1 conjugal transfer relaxosome DNA-binding protein TraM [Serratia fonticola]
MPRIQAFVSNPVYEAIMNLVEEKRQEGATLQDANRSNTTAMLIELGLRVYKMQHERREGGFNQAEYNKLMLENMMKVSFMCSKMLKMDSLMTEVRDEPEYLWASMTTDIRSRAESVVEVFYPSSDDENV